MLDNVGLRLVVRNLDNADPVFFANGGYDRELHNNYGRVVILDSTFLTKVICSLKGRLLPPFF